MTTHTRFRRPDLDRIAPQRHFRGIFAVPPASVESAAPSAAAPPSAAGTSARPVAAGVELGYRVIEEYLEEGQQFARAMFGRSERGAIPNPFDDPGQLNERMVRYASGLASAWLDYVQAWSGALPRGTTQPSATGRFEAFDFGAGSPPSAAEQAPNVPPPSAAGPLWPTAADVSPLRTPLDNKPSAAEVRRESEPLLLELEVSSRQRVSVALELKPGARGPLIAHELRAADPRLAAIAAPTFVTPNAAENRVLMQLTVPDEQPAGVYNALVLDPDSNLPRGTLSVRVIAPL